MPTDSKITDDEIINMTNRHEEMSTSFDTIHEDIIKNIQNHIGSDDLKNNLLNKCEETKKLGATLQQSFTGLGVAKDDLNSLKKLDKEKYNLGTLKNIKKAPEAISNLKNQIKEKKSEIHEYEITIKETFDSFKSNYDYLNTVNEELRNRSSALKAEVTPKATRWKLTQPSNKQDQSDKDDQSDDMTHRYRK